MHFADGVKSISLLLFHEMEAMNGNVKKRVGSEFLVVASRALSVTVRAIEQNNNDDAVYD